MNGKLVKVNDRFVLAYERSLRHPPEKVWTALTQPEGLSAWFPARIDGERRQGARLTFVFEKDEGPALHGEVRVYEPPRVLEYTWGDEVLRFELEREGSGTRLRFTTTFDERVNAPRDGAGWELCLDSLEAALSGEKPQGPDHGQWPRVYTEYVRTMGVGDFPGFLKRDTSPEESAMFTPGMKAWTFKGTNGARVELLMASKDAETAPHLDADGEYLFVFEGEFVLRLAEQEFPIRPGMEFLVPAGSKVSGRVRAGTRMLRAISGRQ